MIVKVLARVHSLVFDGFDDLIHGPREEGAHERPEPVDVMVSREVVRHHARSKASCRIQTASCEEYSDQLGHKQRQPDSYGR